MQNFPPPPPPTPTPFPESSFNNSGLQFPAVSAWDYVDNSVQWWNTIDSQSTFIDLFQALILVGIIAIIIMVLYRKIQPMIGGKDETS